MKHLLILSFFALLGYSTIAQTVDFTVPKSAVLKKDADFVKYESDIMKCIDWFEATPQSVDPKKRKSANSFFIAWLSGTSKVRVEINEKVVSFANQQPELLVYFMAGWVKYALLNQDIDITNVESTYEGLLFALKYYEKGNDVKRNKDVDALVKKMNNNELLPYVEKLVK